jgi:hypothetical protein
MVRAQTAGKQIAGQSAESPDSHHDGDHCLGFFSSALFSFIAATH